MTDTEKTTAPTTVIIRDEEYLVRDEGIVDVPVGPWATNEQGVTARLPTPLPVADARRTMALIDPDLRGALDTLLWGMEQGFGLDRAEGARVIRQILLEPGSEAMLAPTRPPAAAGDNLHLFRG